MLFVFIKQNTSAPSNSIRNAKYSKKNFFLDTILQLYDEFIRIVFLIPHQTLCYVWLSIAGSKVNQVQLN